MHPRARLPLLLAAAGALAFVVLLGLAYGIGIARWADAAALEGFVGLRRPLTLPLFERGAHLTDPLPYGLIGASILLVAVAQRRYLQAVAAAVLLGGSAVSSQVLKPLLAMERPVDFAEVSAAAYPSGHATAAMALALAALLATVPAWRPYVAVAGGAFVLVVSFSLLALGWHFPSDVVGGYLLAGAWCLVAVGALRALAARLPLRGLDRRGRGRFDPRAARAAAGSAGIAAAVVCAALAPQAASYAHRHTTFAAVALAIAAAAAVVLATVTVATRR